MFLSKCSSNSEQLSTGVCGIPISDINVVWSLCIIIDIAVTILVYVVKF